MRLRDCGTRAHNHFAVACPAPSAPVPVSRYTCRTLFERHKLLFSFQMCAKILETSGKLNMDEYNFFLRGGLVSGTEAARLGAGTRVTRTPSRTRW